MRIERTESRSFLVLSAMVRACPLHRRSIDAIFAANADIQILAEPPPTASASLEKPDKNKSACSRGITASA
jgi:hypothetical protein